jgi:transcriptional regulator with XRE-family HTH domain
VVASESSLKSSLQTAYDLSQQELASLENVAIAVCQKLENKEVQQGSTTVSRLRALSEHLDSRVREALLLGTKKALGVVSTHYQIRLPDVADGYAIPLELSEDEALATIEQADAATEEAARTLASAFEGELFPGDDEVGGDGQPSS